MTLQGELLKLGEQMGRNYASLAQTYSITSTVLYQAIEKTIRDLAETTVNLYKGTEELGSAIRGAGVESLGDATAGYLSTINEGIRSASGVVETLQEGEAKQRG